MLNVRIAFKTMSNDEELPLGYQEMPCHMIFDIKLSKGFHRKARLVARGHLVETPAYMTYASVISRETVKIALTLAELNDLEIKTSDIQNACTMCRKDLDQVWTRVRPSCWKSLCCPCTIWIAQKWPSIHDSSGRLHATHAIPSEQSRP